MGVGCLFPCQRQERGPWSIPKTIPFVYVVPEWHLGRHSAAARSYVKNVVVVDATAQLAPRSLGILPHATGSDM